MKDKRKQLQAFIDSLLLEPTIHKTLFNLINDVRVGDLESVGGGNYTHILNKIGKIEELKDKGRLN